MGIATTLMGILPTYSVAGIAAPILLVTLRFLQGFGIGGEWGGAITLVMESVSEKRRGFFGATVQIGNGFGLILASGIVSILTAVMSKAQFQSWAWRIPLLFSAVLIIIGIIIRLKIEESPQFERLEESKKVARVPLGVTLQRHWRMVLLAIGMYIAPASFGFTQGVFLLSYLVGTMKVAASAALLANVVSSVFHVCFTLVGGLASDRFGRFKAYILGGALIIPNVVIMFGSAATGSVPIIMVAMCFVGMFAGFAYGAQAALFFELFPARVRYTGVSLGFQVATVLGGGLTPIFAAALTQATGNTVAISLYIISLAVLLIACAVVVPRVLRYEAKLELLDKASN